MKPGNLYERLSESEESISRINDDDEHPTMPSRPPSSGQRWRIWLSGAVVWAIALAVIQYAIVRMALSSSLHMPDQGMNPHGIHHEQAHPADHPMGDSNTRNGGLSTSHGYASDILECGESPAEARANDCVFDVMMQLWLPRVCYFHERSERFLAKNNWTWYADPYATIEIPDEVMRLGETKTAFMDDSYHRQHCMFTWQNMVQALREGIPLVEEMMSMEHVAHCHMIMFGAGNTKKYPVQTEAHSGFARCATYDVWRAKLPDDSDLTDVYHATMND